MAKVGHYHDEEGRSVFRIFAPDKRSVSVVLTESSESHAALRAASSSARTAAAVIDLAARPSLFAPSEVGV